MAPTDSVPLEIAGFHILPLRLPSVPSFLVPAIHYLYISPHQPRIPSATAPRSLFLVNVPFDSTPLHIKHLLSQQIGLPAGRIEAVRFHSQGEEDSHFPAGNGGKHERLHSKKRKRALESDNGIGHAERDLPVMWDRELLSEGLTAIVRFVDRASMDAALKALRALRKNARRPLWGEGIETNVPALGIRRYENHSNHQYPDKAQILQSVNHYMTTLASREAAEVKLKAKQRQEPDEDGFTFVTRGGRNNPANQEVAKSVAEKHKERAGELDDFYRFQSREKRKEKAMELVRKFHEDKEKIRNMRKGRNTFIVSVY